jgi:hypothetical protein
MRFFPVAALLLSAMLPATAAPPPSPDAARSVIDYYFTGDTVLLVDARLCNRVAEAGPDSHACEAPRADALLETGETTYLWLLLMVPEPLESQTIVIQFVQDGTAFSVQRATVTPSLRYRLWKKLRFDQPGDWQIRVLHERDGTLQPLGEMDVRVRETAAAE